jgi:hypothetical protein
LTNRAFQDKQKTLTNYSQKQKQKTIYFGRINLKELISAFFFRAKINSFPLHSCNQYFLEEEKPFKALAMRKKVLLFLRSCL